MAAAGMWEPFGRLVLRAAYEAILLAAAAQAVEDAGLDIVIVCHGRVDPGAQRRVDRWADRSSTAA